uniref:Centromere/kinetochore protein zw10 n=1 Tax=Plectus sambesii TaxID=2011161 RepID=A0A914VXH1_9BILA
MAPIRKQPQGPVSLVAEALANSGSLERESIDDQVLALEQTIARARAEIAQMVEDQYKNFLPEAISDAQSLSLKIESVKSLANNQLDKINTVLSFTPNSDSRELSDAKRKLADTEHCLSKIAVLSEMAEMFQDMDLLPDDEMSLAYAQLLVNAKEKLKALIAAASENSDEDELFDARVLPSLSEELASQRERLIFRLNEWWSEFVSWQSHHEENVLTLSVWPSQIEAITEKLSALQLLNELDSKLAALTRFLLSNFCEPLLMTSPTSGAVSNRLTFESGGVVNADKRKIRLALSTNETRPDAMDALWSLTQLFDNLHAELGPIHVNGVRLVALMGKKMAPRLIELIISDCLTPAIPADPSETDRFQRIVDSANLFHARLQEIHFIPENASSFEDFVANFDTLFMDRRCHKIIGDGRALITADLHNFVEVGTSYSEDEATVAEFETAFDKVCMKEKENSAISDKDARLDLGEPKLPKLLQFPACKVSDTMVKLVDLLESTLRSAGETDSQKSAARLLETGRNLIELFIVLTPMRHENALSNVPQTAAIFYNNCYYLAHRLMTLGFDVTPAVAKALDVKEFRVTFVDFVPRLRQLAADCIERQLVQRRRELSATLSDASLFDNLKTDARLKQCEKALRSCTMQLEQLSNVCKEVLTTTVLAKAMGNLVAHLLNSLVKMFVAKEDIASSDAELSAQALQRLLSSMEKLFVVKGRQSEIHRFCESAYFRTKELTLCLQGSMQEIADRWCDGKGPLAVHMTPVEVKQLIRALFQNTERRAALLAQIK